MDFSFSDEQEMLRDQVRQFLADRLPPEKVAALVTGQDATERTADLDDVRWKEIAALGWVGLSSPEDAGGSGMGFLDEAVVFEELGYGLYPGPYFSTVALALPALEKQPAALAQVLEGTRHATVDTALIRGESSWHAEERDGGWVLHGRSEDAVALDEGSFVVVCAATPSGDALFLVDASGVPIRSLDGLDPTRRSGALDASEGIAASLLEGPGLKTEAAVTSIGRRALAAAALEAVGVGQRVLELAIAHVKERKQFDKPIGQYQAVSHQVADAYMQVELARSVSYWAAWCVAESDEQVADAVAAANALATDAAVFACERSIQVHGGIGFTWEHILQRYYKRAEWLESFGGYPAILRTRIAGSIVG